MRYQKVAKIKDQLLGEELKMKRKNKQKVFDLLERGFEPQIFSDFPA